MSEESQIRREAPENRGFRPNIPTPGKLDVHARNVEIAWRKFKRQWQNYEIATRLEAETSQYRCAVLLACIGEDAFDIYDGFSFEGETKDDIEVVLRKFEEFFIGEANEIYETFLFNKRNQEEGETIDAYVTSLRKLAKTCNFGNNEERMLRDRIVFGVRDDAIRQKLLEDRKLTLQSSIEMCRAHESSHLQAKAIVSGSASAVDRVQYRRGGAEQTVSKKKCKKCGTDHQPTGPCPARDAECHKCHRRGHYAKVCYSKMKARNWRPSYSHKDISNVSAEQDDAFLGVVHSQEADPRMSHSKKDIFSMSEEQGSLLGAVSSGETDIWHVDVLLDGRKVTFKMDTGADVTVVPEVVAKRRPLQKPTKRLYGAGKKEITVLGQFKAKMNVKNTICTQEVYVVQDLVEPLLGRPAIEALNLVHRVQSLQAKASDVPLKETYPRLFSGLGRMSETYTIHLRDSARPYAVTAPRRIPLPLQEKVKEELKRLVQLDVIRTVSNPTDWCAPIVVVPKEKGAIRICVDLTKLNESVRREHYPMPSTDQLLAQLAHATVFTKLDCNSGFHQLPLDEASQELTTFITPFGRFCYKRLPFGISSGPEVFHRIMSQLLSDIPGVICNIDDILVSGLDQKEHDQRLKEVLQKLEAAGVTLNDKCRFSQPSIKFLGHIISKDGVQMDPEKVEAIQNLQQPKNVPELRRFLGMLNFVQKFVQNLADITKPLRELLKKEVQWTWGDAQESAFAQLKTHLSSPPVLIHYSPEQSTKVSADASSYGLGAVLLQKKEGQWCPVFYSSRSMTPTEQRYAQVEKEALAATWACEKFSDFLLGLPSFTLETDHRPLLALLKTKALDELSPRIQRFRMRLMRYSYEVVYTAGKNLTTADALSRAPVGLPEAKDIALIQDTTAYVETVISSLPASPSRLAEIRAKQQEDQACRKVFQHCINGWPTVLSQVDPEARPFFKMRSDLSVQEGLLMFQTRLVIPETLKKDILCRLHEGHQGIVKCRALAKSSVWWPGLSKQIQSMVENCSTCIQERRPAPEPLQPTPVPDYPWQKVAMDLFDWRGKQYLLVVDYFSRYIEIAHLSSLSSGDIINHCKSIFARHGIPEVVRSDNGPQFAARQFTRFSSDYGFRHETSSPHFPQSNGEAERAVQTVKNLLTKSEDPYLAVLNYRATPLQSGHSPAEMLFGRRLRTCVPCSSHLLQPNWPDLSKMKAAMEEEKMAQKKNFDSRHRAKPLPVLSPGERVFINHPRRSDAEIIRNTGPRSYEVKTPLGGVLRRNRRHISQHCSNTPARQWVEPALPQLIPAPLGPEAEANYTPEPVDIPARATPPSPVIAGQQQGHVTRSGRLSKPPVRMDL